MDHKPNDRHARFLSMLEELPPRESFSLNYQPSRIDRVALKALNSVFPPSAVAQTRTQYHRAHLNFEDLKADLMEYNCPKPPRNVQPSYLAVLESVRRDLNFPKNTIVPLTTGAVAQYPDLPGSKSPGLPYKTQGYKTKREALNDPKVLSEIRQIWYDVEANKPIELPDVACYARAQICTRDKNKIRATWGYPLSVYVAEAAYFYPILEHLKQLDTPKIAYGIEMANGGMAYVKRMSDCFRSLPFLMGDWSKFDKTIPAWLIRDAFKIVEEAIDWTQVKDREGKLWPVRAHRSRRRWRRLVNYFIDTPIRLSDGSRYMKHSGVPSGACFTNIIDSIVNMIVMRYCVYELTGQLPPSDIYLGDDSVIALPKLISLEVLADMAKETFGMDFNFKKSKISHSPENINFLGYHNVDGQPRKPIDTIVASTIYPERPVRDKFETISRLVGQAYSCFEPEFATAFFQAADLVAKEEQISHHDIEDYIRQHPHRFKYLQTIGVDVKAVVFPTVISPDCVIYITQPGNPRRVFKPSIHDPDELYIAALKDQFFDCFVVTEEDDPDEYSITLD
nr:MAG: RNA-dependent RNA polymerase [brine shrimp partiti-like virus 2]